MPEAAEQPDVAGRRCRRRLWLMALPVAWLGLSSPGALGAEVEVRSITYLNGDVEVPARFARPKGEAPLPAVLLVHGRRGYDETTEPHLLDLAGRGFAVLAPDYHTGRFIPKWPVPHDPETEKDVALGVDYLKTIPGVRADRIGVVGISRGGYHALLLAVRRPDVACIATYYGHFQNPNAGEPDQVFRYAPEVDRLAVPILLIIGENDFEIRRLVNARTYYRLLELRRPVELVVYPMARRAFDFRLDQTEEERLATRDARERVGRFLRRCLSD